MLTFTDDEFNPPSRPTFRCDHPAPESFPDLEADVRQSIARIQASPFIPLADNVRGFVYDVATGRLTEVS